MIKKDFIKKKKKKERKWLVIKKNQKDLPLKKAKCKTGHNELLGWSETPQLIWIIG